MIDINKYFKLWKNSTLVEKEVKIPERYSKVKVREEESLARLNDVVEYIAIRTKDMNREEIIDELRYYVYEIWDLSYVQKKEDLEWVESMKKIHTFESSPDDEE